MIIQNTANCSEEHLQSDERREILCLLPLFVGETIDEDREIYFFRLLKEEFSHVNLVKELKQFYTWILDNPDKYDHLNPKFHTRFRKWCERVNKNLW